MAAISATMVKDLREKTGAPMLDCKNALNEAGGDLEKAVEVLRKKGMASAAKKSGRLASEGLVHIHLEGKNAAMVEVNCETDFVGKTDEFQSFVKQVAQHVFKNNPKDRDALLTQTWASAGKSVEEITREMVARIGENISVRRFHYITGKPDQFIGQYIHMGSKIGALVLIQGSKLPDEALRGVAMHVAAAAPRFVSADRIPQAVLDKEKEIYLEQMKDSGKPAEILEKIIDGKVKKFASEVCLDDQIYIKDPEGKLTVSKYLKSLDPQAKILDFVRFQVGEGLEKKQENFAEEVAKQMGK